VQFFGKYDTRFDREFLTQSYLYFNEDENELTPSEFEKLIKSQKDIKKNIVGTIYMYNPYYYPYGYDEKKKLSDQGFVFDGEFHSLKIEKELTLFKQKIKQYPNKIIQIRYLFNLNIENINTSEILMSFNEDLEKLNTNQLTIFDKQMCYENIDNYNVNGKFIFFAWGNKINKKEFVYIYDYAKFIFDKCHQMQKKVSFVFRKSLQQPYSEDNLYFLHPTNCGKLKNKMPNIITEVFAQHPPQITSLDDISNQNLI
jgi:hypothetical protein